MGNLNSSNIIYAKRNLLAADNLVKNDIINKNSANLNFHYNNYGSYNPFNLKLRNYFPDSQSFNDYKIFYIPKLQNLILLYKTLGVSGVQLNNLISWLNALQASPEPAPAPAPAPEPGPVPVQVPPPPPPAPAPAPPAPPAKVLVQEFITPSNFKIYSTEEFISDYKSSMPIIEGLTDPNASSISTDSNLEKTLINQLNTFNQQYQRYIHCNDIYNNKDCKTDGSEPTVGSLNSLIGEINGTINNISKNNYNIGGNVISPTTYQNTYNNINSNYENVLQLRKELDMKVNKLYNPDNSVISDYKNQFDSTIYSGILISALATSILYYVFTEL